VRLVYFGSNRTATRLSGGGHEITKGNDRMPNKQENKSESDTMSSVDPPDDKDGDDVEFVEVDPTLRYGRVCFRVSVSKNVCCPSSLCSRETTLSSFELVEL